MPTYSKIHRGTANHSVANLCDSCSHGRVTETASGAVTVTCSADFRGATALREKVVRCSMYLNSALPNIHTLEQIAWTISVSRTGKVGFNPPKED